MGIAAATGMYKNTVLLSGLCSTEDEWMWVSMSEKVKEQITVCASLCSAEDELICKKQGCMSCAKCLALPAPLPEHKRLCSLSWA